MSAQTSDKLQLFAEHSLFRHLSRDEMTKLLIHARVERHPADRRIFEKGSPGQSMMAVVSGHVKVCALSDEGKEIVFNIINPGQVFGEIALLDGRERTADAVAMTDCELLVVDRRHFLPFLRENPDIATRLLGVLCERLRRTTEQVEDVLFLDLPARLAKTFCSLPNPMVAPLRAVGALISSCRSVNSAP